MSVRKGYKQTPEHIANATAARRARRGAKKSRPMTASERGRLGAAVRHAKRAAVATLTPTTEPNDVTTQHTQDLHFAHAFGVVETTLRNLASDVGIPFRVLAERVGGFLSHRARR